MNKKCNRKGVTSRGPIEAHLHFRETCRLHHQVLLKLR